MSPNVKIAVPVDDGGPVQILLDVRPLRRATRTAPGTETYLRWVEGGSIWLGAQCDGGASLVRGQAYSVALTAVDASGNQSPAPGNPLNVVVPKGPPNGAP